MTALHLAVAESDVERVRELLAEEADVNARDENGATPLHYAAAEGVTQIVRLLLDAGADRSLRDQEEQTPEDWATRTFRGDSESLILLMGFDSCQLPNQDQSDGDQANATPEPGPLERAIQEGDLDAISRLVGHSSLEAGDGDDSTRFIAAVIANQSEVVEFLAKRGTDPNMADEHGETPLHIAVDWGHLEMVRALLGLGVEMNVPGGIDPTLTPLQIACREGNTGIAELLLQHGADPALTQDYDGWTALHYAAFRNHPEIIRILLNHKADIHARSNSYDGQMTALNLALRHEKREAAEVLYSTVARDHPEAYGTPLHAAANIGDWALAETLLRSGTSANVRDYEEMTPLHWAVGERRPLLAELILEYHRVQSAADRVDLSQEEAIRALIKHRADLEARDVRGYTPLIEAAGWGQEAAARVLIETGADVNAQESSGWTPLLFSAAGGRVETLRLLISKGADLQIVRNGWNALTYASHHGHLEAAKLFIAEGVPINPPGWTPLHSAVFMGHREIIDLLLANGADRNAKDEQRGTPSDLAKEQKRMAIVELLRGK